MTKGINIEDYDCEQLQPYCMWEGPACTAGPNGPICCEGRYCEDAFNNYKEENEVECYECGALVDKRSCTEHTVGLGTVYVCEDCEDSLAEEVGIKCTGPTLFAKREYKED